MLWEKRRGQGVGGTGNPIINKVARAILIKKVTFQVRFKRLKESVMGHLEEELASRWKEPLQRPQGRVYLMYGEQQQVETQRGREWPERRQQMLFKGLDLHSNEDLLQGF